MHVPQSNSGLTGPSISIPDTLGIHLTELPKFENSRAGSMYSLMQVKESMGLREQLDALFGEGCVCAQLYAGEVVSY